VTPVEVTRSSIEQAAERIAPWIRRTPVLELDLPTPKGSTPAVLKLELLQHTGSFKARGAFNAMLTSQVDDRGVVAASGGNFGLAVAYAAQRLGHPAAVFVPENSPAVKIDRIRGYGADVHVVPGYYSEAYAASQEWANATGAVPLHAYDQPAVVAGQGTLALELSRQVPGLDTVLVAVGGAGLVGGIAAWFASQTAVVAVEPAACPALHAALAAGHLVDVDVSGVAADSLGARRVGSIGFQLATEHIQQSLLVTDEAIVRARQWLWQEARIAAEPGAATPLAALLEGSYVPRPDERVAVVICGGNADPSDLGTSRNGTDSPGTLAY
jgi:threonine dehydratase